MGIYCIFLTAIWFQFLQGLAVKSLAPCVHMLKCPRGKTPNPKLLQMVRPGSCMVALCHWCVSVCVNGWTRGKLYPSAVDKSAIKMQPSTVYQRSNGTRSSNHRELLDEGCQMAGCTPPTPWEGNQLYNTLLLRGKLLTLCAAWNQIIFDWFWWRLILSLPVVSEPMASMPATLKVESLFWLCNKDKLSRKHLPNYQEQKAPGYTVHHYEFGIFRSVILGQNISVSCLPFCM